MTMAAAPAPAGRVATVAGRPISVECLEERVAEIRRMPRGRHLPPDGAVDPLGLRRWIVQDLVTEALILHEARSAGVELELTARPQASIDVFATLGYTHARFKEGSRSSGLDVSHNELPSTPRYTATVGAQYARPLGTRFAATVYGRAEAVFYGRFEYDDINSVGQEAYSLANFRAGVRGTRLFAEAWVRNAFDTRYIPIAFAYGFFAPSGFVGESGPPRTFGITGGVTF